MLILLKYAHTFTWYKRILLSIQLSTLDTYFYIYLQLYFQVPPFLNFITFILSIVIFNNNFNNNNYFYTVIRKKNIPTKLDVGMNHAVNAFLMQN